MSTTNPRSAAFEILLRIDKERSYADILIDRELSSGFLQGPDRGLLTELVYGVLRRQGTLDYIINRFSKQKSERLERSVLVLLRIGLYQIFYLDRVPVSAAVNETVKLAKVLAPRASGFVNAVLRSADRERDDIAYPDKEKDPVGYLSTFYSHPSWLVAGWIGQLGFAEAESLAKAMAEPPPLTIRTNTLKTSREELMERLASEGVQCEATRFSPLGVRIITAGSVARLQSFRDGLFTVQDESSQLAVMFLSPEPGEKVLDACAAPGGKATHMAQLMGNSGEIIACDVIGRKLRLIGENAARLGISCIKTVPLNTARPLNSIKDARFQRILLDAPCSGLGVIRRNPEGKWWKTAADVAELVRGQKTILENLAGYLKRGGILLYATCSTTREENEAVIDDFLSRHSDFVLEDLRVLFPAYGELITPQGCFRGWPHRQGMDGFFAARLKKI
ncbi:16S rRNA (cytosine(967)-C(5))-methyltransferase RsmB [Geotalea uraniireducens]|uniref:16S rRNA (cytosine(967)-C(5))-methyltransferase n=1 Tax=Geotalea uraniireducens (strain Rf4) TaxID=351605 RepID=A5GDD0_GEOUR|nr:16S rRNA (cytosine(967)-C(5))-methyltransferase RsmB [Geotalea uraniireducens]ABQ24409.1 sun protein [Geotalea uraniireducens Rf4]